MKHEMKLQNKPFEMIKKEIKNIEMRLYDEKRQKININDIIEFVNVKNGEVINVKVDALYRFPTFDKLYEKFDKKSLGYLEDEASNPSDMSKYYTKEDIDMYGVLGIKISVIK